MAGGAPTPQQVQLFKAAGAQYHINPSDLAGIMSVESNFGKNNGPSSAGAIGPMQFEPGTAQGLGINPMDTKQAVFGAAKLLDEYGYQRNPFRAIGAYNGGPGNPQSGYASMVESEAKRLAGLVSGIHGATVLPAQATSPGQVFTNQTKITGGQTDYKDALLSYLMKPTVGLNGSVNLNRSLLGAVNSAPTVPVTATTTTQVSSGPVMQEAASRVSAIGRDINPIKGFTLGRTDMGIDANAAPGSAIRAPNAGKVVGMMPNWYKGQPYIAIELTNGPNRGKIMYVAEQITPHVHVGQTLNQGDVIGTYAPSGTGIEIGWANPRNWQQTLAQGTTGYSEGQQTSAGKQFGQFLSRAR